MLLLQEPPRKVSGHGMSIVVKRREDGPHDSRDDDTFLTNSIRRQLADQHPQLRTLGVNARQGRITLSGRLNRFYLLQLAQTVAMKTSGVQEVTSHVHIVSTAELPLMAD